MWYRRVEAGKHKSAIVALWLNEKDAKKLVLDKKGVPIDAQIEPKEQLHITLCYLGDASALQSKKKLIESAIESFASKHNKLKGHVGGFGCFHGDGKSKPLYASYDSPDLPSFREDLVKTLELVGVEMDTVHGFTPHITLAYMPLATDPRAIDVPDISITFDKLTLCWADSQTHYNLEQ